MKSILIEWDDTELKVVRSPKLLVYEALGMLRQVPLDIEENFKEDRLKHLSHLNDISQKEEVTVKG
jgi:hypothetical protein